MGMRLLVSIGILLAFSEVATGQVQVTPTFEVGDKRVDGSFLKPYDNVWLYKMTLPDGRVVPKGLWSDHMQATKVNGVDALMRVQGVTLVSGKSESTINVFDPRTLTPMWSEAHANDGSVFRRDFQGAHLRTKGQLPGPEPRIAAEQDKVSEFDLPSPVFDFNGGMYGILLVTMPLKVGMSGTFRTIEEIENKPAVDSFRVLREENVSAGARGIVRAWVVESERPGRYTMTFWLTKAAPYVIRLVYTTPTKDSPVYTWEMI